VKTDVRSSERPQVLFVAQVATTGGESGANALRDAISQVDKSLPVLMTLSREHYRLRVLPEPAVPQREMLTSLRWSISTEADSSFEDMNIAWMRIPTDEQLPARPRQIYAITTPKAWLSTQLAAWRQAGVRPKVVDIRETALRNISGAIERPGEGMALLSVDDDGVSMVFTHQGSLYLDRFIELPIAELRVNDMVIRQRWYERIAVQLMRSIDVVARSYPFIPIARVVVGPAPESRGLVEFLSAQLPLPVETLDLTALADLSRVPELANSIELQARCLIPLGAALRSANS
jgi:hypothetical protein